MPAFCTKCGASLPSSTSFCPACGTPVAATGEVLQPGFGPGTPGGTGAPPPPPYGHPADDYLEGEPADSGRTLKIVLIVVAVVVALGAATLAAIGYGGWKVARAMHVDKRGNATLSVPGGTFAAGKEIEVSEEELGVPVYPGAVVAEGGMRMKTPSNLMVSASYTTGDSPDSVLNFYRGKLGGDLKEVRGGRGTTLHSEAAAGNVKDNFVITVTPNVQASSGKTQIMILHTKSTRP